MHGLLRATRWLLAAATILYCAGLIALALLWTFGTRGIWWLELANIFAPYWFAPLVLLVPLVLLLSRSWLLRGAVLLACMAFLALFGPRMIPPAAPASDGRPIRVATFNLHAGLAEPRLTEIVGAIQAHPADVVMLQELSVPAAETIRQRLARDYPYQALAPSAEFTGTGLLSRYPLDIPQRQGNAMQTARLRLGDTSVTLVNVSLTGPEVKRRRLPGVGWVWGLGGYHTGKRSRELDQLLRALDQVRGPLVVSGDFNLSDREADYDRLAARLHDAYSETRAGFGHTFPSELNAGPLTVASPLIRIDYVWSAGGVSPATADVSCVAGSDHCMVIADLLIGSS